MEHNLQTKGTKEPMVTIRGCCSVLHIQFTGTVELAAFLDDKIGRISGKING